MSLHYLCHQILSFWFIKHRCCNIRVCVCVIINSKLSSAITKWPSSTINDDDDQPKFPVDLYGTYTSHTCTFYTLFPVCLTLFYPSLYHVSLFPYSFLFCPIHYYHYHYYCRHFFFLSFFSLLLPLVLWWIVLVVFYMFIYSCLFVFFVCCCCFHCHSE